jgi:hypothetical protein
VLVGGPDFAYRGYEAELHRHATALGLDGVVRWLGDRADVPRLLAGLDALVRLSEDEGIPHVLAQAGAACLPVVATRDNGAAEQIADGRSGLFVPHRAPAAAAAARSRLVRDPDRAALRARAQGLTDVHLHVTHVRDDPAVVGRVRARGLLVAVGIVDDPDEAEAMAALGVDLLCTDDPVGLGLARAGRTSADAAVVAG